MCRTPVALEAAGVFLCAELALLSMPPVSRICPALVALIGVRRPRPHRWPAWVRWFPRSTRSG